MQFHILSFEGVDAYSRIGGLATRIDGLTGALAGHGLETHLWFVGDPSKPGYERHGDLHLHRWCQWISAYKPNGVYDGEFEKASDFAASLPRALVTDWLMEHIERGGHGVILAEEWQTVHAVLHLDWILKQTGLRERTSIFWNANNTFGFDNIDWTRLAGAATITAVSRYMKHSLEERGVDALVIPNGLSADAFLAPDRAAVTKLRQSSRDRIIIAKMARWDPDKRWLGSVHLIGELKRHGWRPLFLARGGTEPHGRDVLAAARAAGLKVVERSTAKGDVAGLLAAVADVGDADMVHLDTPIDADGRRVLLRGADAVLANSAREPFGLVGLETMAVGGIACTGCSGEDYAIPGHNALVLQTGDSNEFMGMYVQLRDDPAKVQAMRRAGRATARQYEWPEVIRRSLLPRLQLTRWRRNDPVAARAVELVDHVPQHDDRDDFEEAVATPVRIKTAVFRRRKGTGTRTASTSPLKPVATSQNPTAQSEADHP